MPRNSLTPAVIREEIEAALGKSGVEIELDDDDFEKCLKDVIRTYNRNRPGQGRFGLRVSPQQKKYGPLGPSVLSTIPATIQGVRRVQFVTNQAPITDPFDTINNGIGRILSGSGTPFGEIDQQLAYIKMARVVAGSDPEYQQNWEGASLFLYIDVARTPLLCSVEYTYHYTADENAVTGVGMIPDGDTDFVVGFGLARAKQILGRIRGKHQGITNEEGSTDPIEYDAILSEGREEEREWLEEIKKRRRPLLPTLG